MPPSPSLVMAPAIALPKPPALSRASHSCRPQQLTATTSVCVQRATCHCQAHSPQSACATAASQTRCPRLTWSTASARLATTPTTTASALWTSAPTMQPKHRQGHVAVARVTLMRMVTATWTTVQQGARHRMVALSMPAKPSPACVAAVCQMTTPMGMEPATSVPTTAPTLMAAPTMPPKPHPGCVAAGSATMTAMVTGTWTAVQVAARRVTSAPPTRCVSPHPVSAAAVAAPTPGGQPQTGAPAAAPFVAWVSPTGPCCAQRSRRHR